MKLLTMPTPIFQDMVSKAVKGCSNDKMFPLTSLMGIELRDNKLTLTTTDATNYLYVSHDKIEGEDFSVTVKSEQFVKLISKTTSDNITISIEDDNLKFVGNGTYTIELPLDEEGQLIKFPNPLDAFDVSNIEATSIHLSTIKTILDTAQNALGDIGLGCYSGYYIGNSIIATDTFKICGIDIKLFDEPILLSAEFVKLLDTMTEENLEAYISGDTIAISDGNIKVYGKALAGISDYQVDAITGLINQSFTSMCKLPKDALLSVLDRLALFVGNYDDNCIYLTFTNKGLMLNSKKSTGSEIIEYQESENFADFTCCIDIEMFRTQAKSIASPVIELWYGAENAVKMVDGTITQIVALSEDNR